MSTAAEQPAPTEHRGGRAGGRVGKRILGIALLVLLLVVNLVLGAYLLRRPLFEGLLRRLAAEQLGELLLADVRIGSIGGNWLTSLRLDGVQLAGRGLLRRVDGLSLELQLSPWQLAGGDLGGLRAARVHADAVELDLAAPATAPGPAPAADGGEPFDPAVLDGLLGGGFRLEVGEFRFGIGADRRRGPLQLLLEPGTGRRRLSLRHQGLAVNAGVRLDRGRFDLQLAVDEPVQLLGCLAGSGLGVDARGGRLTVGASVALAPLQFAGQVTVAGLQRDGKGLPGGSLWVAADQHWLHVDAGRLELPGLQLATGGLSMPSPLGEGPLALAAIAGSAELAVGDLTPYAALLPEPVRTLLPLRGEARVWLDAGVLHVGRCRFAGPDVELAVERGQLPLVGGDAGGMQLEAAVELQRPHTFALGGVELTTAGSIAARIGGSLTALEVQGELALGATAAAGFAAERLAAEVAFGGGALQVSGLRAEGLRAVGAGADAPPSRLQGRARLLLPEADAPLRIDADVAGEAAAAMFGPLGADEQLLARLQHPFVFVVSGQLALPAGGRPEGRASVRLTDVAVRGLPAAAVAADLELQPGRLRVARCQVLAPAAIDLHGDLPLQPGGALAAELRAEQLELAPWAALAGLDGGGGRLSLQARVGGTLAAPQLDVTVDASVLPPAAWLQAWPQAALGPAPGGPLALSLRAHHGDAGIAVDELRLAGGGGDAGGASLQLQGSGDVPLGAPAAATPAPFALQLQGQGPGPADLRLPWTLALALQVGAERSDVQQLQFAAGAGSLSGTAALLAGWRQLLAAPSELGPAGLQGRLQLAELRLDLLPAQAIGLTDVAGTCSGELVLAGTLQEPEPHLTLQLAGVQLRAPGVPRISKLSAAVEVGPQRLQVKDLRADMGAGPVTFDATVASSDRSWAVPQAITVDAHLRGEQALLVNTPQLKLRGDADLRLSGTLQQLQLTGELGVTTGRFAQRITALPGLDTLRGRGGRGSGEGLRLHLLDPPLGERIAIDVKLRTVRDFEVRTHTLDTDLRADLRLIGTAAAASLRGTVAGSSGTLRLPGTNMQLRSLLVSFTEQHPLHPNLNLLAEGRRHGYRIQLQLDGTTQAPQIALTSTPALPPEDLLVLVTTGVLPSRLANQDSRAQAGMVGAYLAQELAGWYFGGESTEAEKEGFLDRFSVEMGREISDSGLETILVEFKLTDLLALQAERDVYEDYNGGLSLRFRFR